nr:MAG TPA: hypothetical protein [Caudoviricetes sp.]
MNHSNIGLLSNVLPHYPFQLLVIVNIFRVFTAYKSTCKLFQ